MTIQKVEVFSRRGLVALDGNLMETAVLSIIDPGGNIPVIRECNWLLCLAFHDETNPYYGTVISDAQARCIAAYLMAVHAAPEVRKLIVQCEMGISRSAGIASAVCEHWNLPFENPEINGQPRYRLNPFVRQKVLTALLDGPSPK